MKKELFLLSGLLLTGGKALSADWYASPNGSSNGSGSINSPMSLTKALGSSSPARPGDTIWLRGGVYKGRFGSSLKGSSSAPITVTSYPGEWARLDTGGVSGKAAVLRISGSYTTYRDFEVMSSDTKRVTSIAGDEPSDIVRGEGIQVVGPSTKLINLVIHDTKVGVANWSEAPNSEVYGCIIYNNGWQGPKEGGSGHGIYAQNQTGSKIIKDNIVFNQYGKGLQIYGSSSAYVRNFNIEGNVVFNSGISSRGESFSQNVVLYGGGGPSGIVFKNNYFYSNGTAGTLQIGGEGAKDIVFQGNYVPQLFRFRDWSDAVVTGNTFFETSTMVELTTAAQPSRLGYTWNNNSYFDSQSSPFSVKSGSSSKSYSFSAWKSATGFDSSSTFASGRPGNKIVVRPNQYEKGRATIIAYNWAKSSTINVGLNGVLSAGQKFEVRNAQNYFAAPVLTGTYNGSSITLPTTGLFAATPIGGSRATSPGAEFNVYVVRATSSGGSSGSPGSEEPTPSNTAPTLSSFSNRTIDKNAGTGAISFTIGDSQTSASSLSLIGASSNPTLVPTANIRFSGSGSSRTVTVTPAANRTGSATISISVSDGSLVTTRSFVLTVRDTSSGSPSGNTAPTISSIPDLASYNALPSQPVSFTIGDSQTSASSLTIRASSSNTSLVPNSGIILDGSGSSRTVSIRPNAGQFGTATITLTVSDGSLSTSRSFTYSSVNSLLNKPPVLSDIPTLTSYNGEATAPVRFTVDDKEFPEWMLVVKADPSDESLVPVQNVAFGGSGVDRTISVKPAPGKYGTTKIYVLSNDTKKTVITSFVFNSVRR